MSRRSFEAARGERRLQATLEGETGPLVVLVPGLGQGSKLFGTLPRRFAREGFRCVTFDPIGIPPSSPHPADAAWTFEAAADDVLTVLDTVDEDRGPAALVGTSLGGKIAIATAARYPERVDGLVTLASAFVPSARGSRVFRFFDAVATHVPDEAFGTVVAPFLIGRSFIAARPNIVDDLSRAMKPTAESRTLMRAQANALASFDGEAAARAVRTRTLCLAGREDTLTDVGDVEATAQLIAGAEFEAFDNAGHSLLLESAPALDRVLAFLHAP